MILVNINQTEKAMHALLDCGSMGNFISPNTVERYHLTHTPHSLVPLHDVQGLHIGQITSQVTLNLHIRTHEE
jgi:hypothetical protein